LFETLNFRDEFFPGGNMFKTDVIKYYVTASATASALGISKPTVSLWKEIIPWKYALLIEKKTNGALNCQPEHYPEQFPENNQNTDK